MREGLCKGFTDKATLPSCTWFTGIFPTKGKLGKRFAHRVWNSASCRNNRLSYSNHAFRGVKPGRVAFHPQHLSPNPTTSSPVPFPPASPLAISPPARFTARLVAQPYALWPVTYSLLHF